MVTLIAQQAAREASNQILLILAVVVALAILIGIVGWIVRKLTLGSDNAAAMPGLTLADLRKMHREGHMTDDEFEAAKRLVLAQGLSLMTPPEQAATLAGDVSDPGVEPRADAGENRAGDSDKNGDDDASPGPV